MSGPVPSWKVLVLDLFHLHDDDEHYEIEGFATVEQAREFCRRFNLGSLRHCWTAGMTADEAVTNWVAFGEAASVIGDPERTSSSAMVQEMAQAGLPDDPAAYDHKALDPRR